MIAHDHIQNHTNAYHCHFTMMQKLPADNSFVIDMGVFIVSFYFEILSKTKEQFVMLRFHTSTFSNSSDQITTPIFALFSYFFDDDTKLFKESSLFF
jgi:hypothetical protein